MDIIPPAVRSVVEKYLVQLLYWFSDEIYKLLLPRAQNHFLVGLRNHLNFGTLETACAKYHHEGGRGAPVVHPVSRLVRALLVKYLLNLSLRNLEESIRWNLLVKWFVGYAAFESGPDHATLERFELWVIEHQTRTFFDQILNQIDHDFADDRDKSQIGDTYAMRTNAATETIIWLIRHTCQRLLTAWQEMDEAGLAAVRKQLDREAIFGAEDEAKEFRLDQTQRGNRLQRTVAAALQCQALIRAQLAEHPSLPEAQRQAVSALLDILNKIMTDEVSITRNEAGEITSVQELPKNKKGSYRIASTTDYDATFRVHGEKTDFGYNVNLAATDTFIREIRADTGSQPDPVAIPDLLTAQQEYHDFMPVKLIYDKAAGTGKHHADVDKASDGQTQLVAPLMPYDQRSERFAPDDFTLSPDDHSLTCPRGRVSTTAYRSQSGDGRSFRFTPAQCADCPLFAQCRGDQVPASHIRQVFISDHRSILAKARTYAQTPQFRLDLKLRSTVERIIANLVRYHGARRAHRRGRLLCDFQAKMCATAFNLRQWLRRLQRQAKAASAVPQP
ncbi:MAG: transposase [Anaerolineae bacterium]